MVSVGCVSPEDVILDSESANPNLLISTDEKRLRCGLERRVVPPCPGRFDGWWCAVGKEAYSSGRHYWEVEVGERDWRLGVAKASAVRQGFRSLNTDTGYLTIRLERGTDLKALTVPATLLPQNATPRKVGVYLDYELGQLSFYDVEKRSHLYTYNENFTEELYPLFGTVEVVKDLVVRPTGVRLPCLCPGPCLWTWVSRRASVSLHLILRNPPSLRRRRDSRCEVPCEIRIQNCPPSTLHFVFLCLHGDIVNWTLCILNVLSIR